MSSGKRWRLQLTLHDERVGEFDVVFQSDLSGTSGLDWVVDRGCALAQLMPDHSLISSRISEICLDCGRITATIEPGVASLCRCPDSSCTPAHPPQKFYLGPDEVHA